MSTMLMIRPNTITAAMVTGTTATETVALWSNATTYAVGDLVRLESTRAIYRSLQAANLNKDPVTQPTWWVYVSADNRMAMFDEGVGSATTATTEFTVTLRPGRFAAVAFLNTTCAAIDVTITDMGTSTVVYSGTVAMSSYEIVEWYDYLTAPLDYRTETLVTNLPSVDDPELELRFYGSTGDTVSCGVLAVGYPYELGSTEYGASVGILDYSKKITSEDGITTLTPGKFAKRMDLTLQCDASKLNRNLQVLSAVRATPCVWAAASDTPDYEALITYGWAREFDIVISYPTVHLCRLRIEGLT
jgi:hypothetical protein